MARRYLVFLEARGIAVLDGADGASVLAFLESLLDRWARSSLFWLVSNFRPFLTFTGRTDLVRAYSVPYVYVDRAALGDLPLLAVEQTIADALSALPGVKIAVPSAGSTSRADEDGPLVERVRRNYRENRSGEVYVIQEAQWQIDGNDVPLLLQHEAAWAYDTYVPIAFTGADVVAAMVYRAVSTVDVAATLAAYARTNQPSASVGTPLPEVFERKK